jgi:transcriptional regulator with XRE-family HTH domain
MIDRLIRTSADMVALFGRRARQLGLTHLEVDARAGLSEGHFSKVMCGSRMPSLQTVERLCGALDIAFAPINGRSSFDGGLEIGNSSSVNVGRVNVEEAS